MMKPVFVPPGVFVVCAVCLAVSCKSNDTTVPEVDTEPFAPDASLDDPALIETLGEDCHDIESPESAPSVLYHRLRFDYATSSDWSKLEFSDTSSIIKVRTMSVEGEAKKAIADYDGITVNQSSDSAKAGNVIRVVADYAFRPKFTDTPPTIKLGQGVIGTITLRISMVTGEQVSQIKEITVPRDAEFLLDVSSLADVPPSEAPLAPIRRMAWALYYPWYNMGWWGKDTLRDQPEIPYDSGDEVAVERQIQQAKSAGIEGFISSWWGPETTTDRNLAVVLDVAGRNDFYVGMFLETRSIVEDNNGDLALVEDELVRWIEFYVTNYGSHPGTMKVAGKTFIMPWITCTLPVETWKNVRERLRSKSIEVTMIADCQQPEYFDVFDGANGENPEIGKTLRYYAVMADDPTPKIWTSDARPGYDERLLGRENPRYTDREDGLYFRKQLSSALAANPQWIRIYTWNEYPENTYIEPSENFGDKYLKIAAEYLLPWNCPK